MNSLGQVVIGGPSFGAACFKSDEFVDFRAAFSGGEGMDSGKSKQKKSAKKDGKEKKKSTSLNIIICLVGFSFSSPIVLFI